MITVPLGSKSTNTYHVDLFLNQSFLSSSPRDFEGSYMSVSISMPSSTKIHDGGSTVLAPAPALPAGQIIILNEPVPASVSPSPPANYGAVSNNPESFADIPEKISSFGKAKDFVLAHTGLFMLLGAHFLASIQGLITRFLAISLPDGRRYHAFEVLFARMSITLIGCLAWMWWNSVEHAPFGRKDVRWLLVARGLGGLVGVYGLYSKHTNLPLPPPPPRDTTVLRMLSLWC